MARIYTQDEVAEMFRRRGAGRGVGVTPAPARQVYKRGKMNGLESDYGQRLEILKRSREILDWRFEPIKLQLLEKRTYRPDFLVMTLAATVEFHETKGFWREDARLKFEMAIELFPWFAWVGVTRRKREWIFERHEKQCGKEPNGKIY